jgi:hypothetical protein
MAVISSVWGVEPTAGILTATGEGTTPMESTAPAGALAGAVVTATAWRQQRLVADAKAAAAASATRLLVTEATSQKTETPPAPTAATHPIACGLRPPTGTANFADGNELREDTDPEPSLGPTPAPNLYADMAWLEAQLLGVIIHNPVWKLPQHPQEGTICVRLFHLQSIIIIKALAMWLRRRTLNNPACIANSKASFLATQLMLTPLPSTPNKHMSS